jgi:hypothetical protein
VAYEWCYGAVYSPKWIKGLTLSADWWHIDMRSIASLLGTQFVVDNNIPGLVIRGPSTTPGRAGPIILVIDPNENLTGAIFEGLDYEATYILDSSIFGYGDFGRVTATLNGTCYPGLSFRFCLIQNGSVSRASLFRRDSP